MDKHMAMERFSRFEKENLVMAPPTSHSFVARHSPVRETIVRRSVSPLATGPPLGPPLGAPSMSHYSNYAESRYS